MLNYLLIAIMAIVWLLLFILIHKTPDNNAKSIMQLFLLFCLIALILFSVNTTSLSLEFLL